MQTANVRDYEHKEVNNVLLNVDTAEPSMYGDGPLLYTVSVTCEEEAVDEITLDDVDLVGNSAQLAEIVALCQQSSGTYNDVVDRVNAWLTAHGQ